MPVSRDQLLRTSHAFIDAMNVTDIDAVISLRTPECVHKMLPKTLGIPEKDNKGIADLLEQVVLKEFRKFSVWLVEGEVPIVDETNRKVVLHAKSRGESDKGLYENEYFFTLTTNEDGTRLTEVIEFMDSACLKEFHAR